MAQRTMPTEEPSRPGEPTADYPVPSTSMAVWIYDGPVYVAIVDLPSPHVPSGVCRCGACHGELYLPPPR